MTPTIALQTALYGRLSTHAGLAAFGVAVVDGGVPDRLARPRRCLSFGPSSGYLADADEIDGTVEVVQLDLWSDDGGELGPAREIVDVIRRALHEAELELEAHGLVEIRVTAWQVIPEPNGLTAHGILTLEAAIEAEAEV